MNMKGYKENGDIDYEIINGNGYIKKYSYDDKLEFEGEVLNGYINGKDFNKKNN